MSFSLPVLHWPWIMRFLAWTRNVSNMPFRRKASTPLSSTIPMAHWGSTRMTVTLTARTWVFPSSTNGNWKTSPSLTLPMPWNALVLLTLRRFSCWRMTEASGLCTWSRKTKRLSLYIQARKTWTSSLLPSNRAMMKPMNGCVRTWPPSIMSWLTTSLR